MTLSERVLRTVQTKSILIDLAVFFGSIPNEDMAGDFMMQLLDILIEVGFAPDAVGYDSKECVLTLTYRHLIELAKVDKAMREAIHVAEQIVRREERRRKTSLQGIGKFNMPKKPNSGENQN